MNIGRANSVSRAKHAFGFLPVKSRMRMLLSIILGVAFVAGCRPKSPVALAPLTRSDTIDFTDGRSAICEIHDAPMSAQRVELGFGMKALTPIGEARRRIFPHADERYDTGYCIPMSECCGRVFVCRQCTEARAIWLSTNKTAVR